jgi:hypothetical protein
MPPSENIDKEEEYDWSLSALLNSILAFELLSRHSYKSTLLKEEKLGVASRNHCQIGEMPFLWLQMAM